MAFEVIVRPTVFPDIRPATARVLPPEDDPTKGMATISGGGAKFMSTSSSHSTSVSYQVPRRETKRQYDTERVYQVDAKGNINKANFVDIERLSRIRMEGEESGAVAFEYTKPPPADNVEIKETDKTRSSS